jgi:hypothetical protein
MSKSFSYVKKFGYYKLRVTRHNRMDNGKPYVKLLFEIEDPYGGKFRYRAWANNSNKIEGFEDFAVGVTKLKIREGLL